MYRICHGGRGSGKSRSFATMTAVRGIQCSQAGQDGVIVCGREFQNSLEDSSFAEVKGAILDNPWMLDFYELGDKYIRTKDGRINYSFIGLRHNLGSVKSKSKIRLLWVDEAEPVSQTAWDIIDPTIREEGAELWVTYNPARKNSATNKKFRLNPPVNSKIIELNWRDNPKFPTTLQIKREQDQLNNPDQYNHIWEGDYITVQTGAYYAKSLTLAKQQNRICRLSLDPLMQIKAFWDIGGTGGRADACSIWIAQFVGREIRLIDYYEVIGQPLSAHVQWLHNNGYSKAHMYLPHDGVNHDKVYSVTYESELRRARFEVTTIPNQGAGAANLRIESLRRVFPSLLIDSEKCAAGIEALGWYHEKWDDIRGIGLGPSHDWSSNCADSAGLMAIVAEDIIQEQTRLQQRQYTAPARVGGWMG